MGSLRFIQGTGSQLMFTGDLTQLDPEVLWDTPNREFAGSDQGRWLSPDPAGSGWNQYAYPVNPLSNLDPTGLAQCSDQQSPAICQGGYYDGTDFFINWTNWDSLGEVQTAPSDGGIYEDGGCLNCVTVPAGAVLPPNNGATSGPVVLKNPCSVQGRALPPGAYVTQGQQANSSTVNFALDVAMGWPKGDYLDPQPLASGNVSQNQAYGNYVFGVYMASAGVSLNSALSGANAYAFLRSSYPSGTQMDPNYGSLPAANVANITNGYNAVGNGTVCHN